MQSLTHPLVRHVVVALVVALHLLGDLVAIPIVYRLKFGEDSGLSLAMLFGVLLGQTSLVAAYLAWAPERWFVRWGASCLLMLLVWYAIAAGAVSTGDSFEVSSIEQLLLMVTALPFLFLSVACWALRAICGSRLDVISDDRIPQRELQSLLPLPAVAVGAIVMLGAMFQSRIGREIWAGNWSISSGDWLMFTLWMAIWAGLCALVALPAAWACLGESPPASRLLRVGIYVALVTALEWGVLYAATGEPGVALLMVPANLGVLCEVIGCGLLLRACGCRLHLRGSRSAS